MVGLARKPLAARGFALGFGHEFFRLYFVTKSGDGRDEIVFREEINKHREVFVVHDNQGIVVVGHELELHFVGIVD